MDLVWEKTVNGELLMADIFGTYSAPPWHFSPSQFHSTAVNWYQLQTRSSRLWTNSFVAEILLSQNCTNPIKTSCKLVFIHVRFWSGVNDDFCGQFALANSLFNCTSEAYWISQIKLATVDHQSLPQWRFVHLAHKSSNAAVYSRCSLMTHWKWM